MNAMVLEKPGHVTDKPLERRTVPEPTPGPAEVLVHVDVCGVCRTDLHEVEGELPLRRSPVIPGHQVVGTVEALGEGAKRFRTGDRIGVAWLHKTCGQCGFCLQDQENLCDRADFTGWTVDGGYAEYVVVPEMFAYRLPDGLEPERAAPLLCAGIIGYRALRLSGIRAGQRLGLYGFGNSAHITIQVARHRGCEVFVFTRSESNRQLARELGATWVGGADDSPPANVHASIIFAPAGPIVRSALEVLEKGGTIALAGIYMTPIPELDYMKHLYGEKCVQSVTNSTRRDGQELLEVAAEIPIRTTVQTFPLHEANEALIALKTGKLTGAAVLLTEC